MKFTMKFTIAFAIFLCILSINLNFLCYEPIFITINDNENATSVLRYVKGEDVDVNFLSLNEISHLNDVRLIVVFSNFYYKIFLLILIFIVVSKRWNLIINSLKLVSFLILFFNFLILIYSSLFFESFFINFHKIFFPQGNWSFERDSMLIQLFPLDFWYKTSLIFIIMNIFDGIILFCIYYFLKKAKSISE